MHKRIVSFDGTEVVISNVQRPEKYNDLFSIINSSEKIIARGAGLSYVLASASNNSVSIDITRFNRFLDFNIEKGTIKVEAGLRISDFIQTIIKYGWYFPVLPGYPSITIGGCIAFNVHGKSQKNVGVFGDYILSLTLLHPEHGEIICSKNTNYDIFKLTIGGFGLTGIILDVTLKLRRLEGTVVFHKKKKCHNLKHALDIMMSEQEEFSIIYSWNNLNRRNGKFGVGWIYCENQTIEINRKSEVNIEFKQKLSSENRGRFGICLYNNFTSKMMCNYYFLKETISKKKYKTNLLDDIFPIYGKEIYYLFFGKRGFREYQFIIPYRNWIDFVDELSSLLYKSQIETTLGSLKLFKGETKYLNFQKEGVCLAIDIPAFKKNEVLFDELDKLVIQYEGIVNLSKDSRISYETVKKMYGKEFDNFWSELHKYDPNQRFHSELRARLDQ